MFWPFGYRTRPVTECLLYCTFQTKIKLFFSLVFRPPSDNRTQIYHLNTRLVRYSDGYCIFSTREKILSGCRSRWNGPKPKIGGTGFNISLSQIGLDFLLSPAVWSFLANSVASPIPAWAPKVRSITNCQIYLGFEYQTCLVFKWS